MPTGIYLSVPFCRSKCSFCNFASGVFSRDQMNAYMTRLRDELTGAEALAESFAAEFDHPKIRLPDEGNIRATNLATLEKLWPLLARPL